MEKRQVMSYYATQVLHRFRSHAFHAQNLMRNFSFTYIIILYDYDVSNLALKFLMYSVLIFWQYKSDILYLI